MAQPTPDQIPLPRGGPTPESLDPIARVVLTRIDGETTLAAIADAAGIPPELACRVAAALERDRLIRFAGGASEEPGDAAPGAAGAGADEQGLESDVDRLARDIGARNYYELLEVEPSADRKELRAAYFRLSKQYHPDRAFGPRRDELRKKMEGIFTRLTRAYETLSSEKERAAYDAHIAEHIELWKIERQLKQSVEFSKRLDAAPAAQPDARETRPITGPQRPQVTFVRGERSPAPTFGPPGAVSSHPPERRRPSRALPADATPTDAEARRQQWKKERAGRALGAMLSRPPGAPGRQPDRDAEGRIQQAMLAMEVEKHSEAVRLLQEVLAADAAQPRARELLKRAEAGAAKELALGYLRQARYERQHGDADAARAQLEKALAVDAGAIDARHQLAELLLETRRDLGRALQLCREVIGLGGQRAKYFVTLGDILLLSKDKERAAAAFERALALEPDNKETKKRLKGCRE